MNRSLGRLSAGVALGVALAASPARAALGEPESSVARDRRSLSAVARGSTDRGAYSVHELDVGGTAVREYVSPQGVVFAVTWAGLANPDLHTLLGRYAAEYEQAASRAAGGKGRRSRRVAGANVVVDHWGHMRDRHGRAWVPDLVPQGVRLDEIQ